MSPTARLLVIACLTLPAVPILAAAADDTAKQCIADNGSGLGEANGTANFTVNLANGCDRKVACRIEAYVTGARGPAYGHTTLSFPPKAQSPATMSYVLRVKSAGGTAQFSKECRFL
jgi:hypothetical protein